MTKFVLIQAKAPGWKWRAIVTLFLFVGYIAADRVLEAAVREEVEQKAVSQLTSSPEAYRSVRLAASADPFPYLSLVLAGLLLMVWVSYIVRVATYVQLPQASTSDAAGTDKQ